MNQTSQSSVDALFARLESPVKIPVRGFDGEVRTHSHVRATPQPELEAYTSRVDALFNDTPDYLSILQERPEHRVMLWMAANGNSTKQIADATNYSVGHVSAVKRQPWFKVMFVRLTSDLGRDTVQEFLKGEVMDSLVTLRDVRDDEDARKADRIVASNSLLDRFLGKPTVHVESKNTNVNSTISADRARLEEEMRLNEAALKARLGKYQEVPQS